MTYAKSIIALLCLVTFAGQPTAAANQVADNWTTGGEINIRDRLDTRQQFTNDGQILFRPDITNVERFTGAVDRLRVVFDHFQSVLFGDVPDSFQLI